MTMPDFARSLLSANLRTLVSEGLGLVGVCVTIVAALFLPVIA